MEQPVFTICQNRSRVPVSRSSSPRCTKEDGARLTNAGVRPVPGPLPAPDQLALTWALCVSVMSSSPPAMFPAVASPMLARSSL